VAKTLSKEQRVLRARLAAHTMHAQHDSRETSAAARAAFMAKFIDQVDPQRALPESERLRRAEHARKAYFTKLAMASAASRSAKKAAR
jgi:hypothetical protein